MNQDQGGKQGKLAAGVKSDAEIVTPFTNSDQSEPSSRLQSSVRELPGAQITSGEEKSALISGLVAQLKRRNITKTELLGRMQDLQRSAEDTTTTGDEPSESCPVLPAGMPDHRHLRQKTAPSGDVSTTGSAAGGGGGSAVSQAAGFFSSYDRQVYPAQSELSLSTSGVFERVVVSPLCALETAALRTFATNIGK